MVPGGSDHHVAPEANQQIPLSPKFPSFLGIIPSLKLLGSQLNMDDWNTIVSGIRVAISTSFFHRLWGPEVYLVDSK